MGGGGGCVFSTARPIPPNAPAEPIPTPQSPPSDPGERRRERTARIPGREPKEAGDAGGEAPRRLARAAGGIVTQSGPFKITRRRKDRDGSRYVGPVSRRLAGGAVPSAV